ncbi:MAG: M15 family metallopeptidase [Actinomycetota bacterium]
MTTSGSAGSFRRLGVAVLVAGGGGLLLFGCGLLATDNSRAAQTYEETVPATITATTATTAPTPTAALADGDTETASSAEAAGTGAEVDPPVERPAWLGTRTLPTTANGRVVPQTTPEELRDRRLPTVDTLPPPPPDAPFRSTAQPLDRATLDRSTWTEGCPVAQEDLTYLTLSFWGFDGRPHTGELIVNRAVAEDIISVFATLFESRFPIEEMRLVTPADLDAPPTGDGNNTASFVCRPVTGGTVFSQHAYGLAVDINPFHNPYRRNDLVLPELATSYLDRTAAPGVITDGDVVVAAFERIGWFWGGRWVSLKDYQHFSLNNR